MRPLTLARHVDALKRGRAPVAPPTSRCPACGAAGRVPIITRGRECCAACAPSTRVCVRCRVEKPLTGFDVSRDVRLGLKLETRCVACRRESQRADYQRKMASGHRPVSRKECRTCGRVKPQSVFYRDGRYVDGLLSDCKTCLNEKKARLRAGD